jgi:hypothetical protein
LNRRWIADIKGALTVGVIVDYLHLWNILANFVLQSNTEDRHIFRLSSNVATLQNQLIWVFSLDLPPLGTMKGLEILGSTKMMSFHLVGGPK